MKIPKKITPFLFFLLTLSIQAQTGPIITSKEKAIRKGIYSTPDRKEDLAISEPKKGVTERQKAIRKTEPKKSRKSFQINTQNEEDILIDFEETSYLVEQLINNSAIHLGTRYRSGGTTSEGFDCSGLMYSTFKRFNIILPRSSHEMAKIGTVLSPSEYKKGDLIFFRTFGGKRISHVGMITEVLDGEIKFIHSSTQLGVIISSTKEPYYQRTFAQVNRILE